VTESKLCFLTKEHLSGLMEEYPALKYRVKKFRKLGMVRNDREIARLGSKSLHQDERDKMARIIQAEQQATAQHSGAGKHSIAKVGMGILANIRAKRASAAHSPASSFSGRTPDSGRPGDGKPFAAGGLLSSPAGITTSRRVRGAAAATALPPADTSASASASSTPTLLPAPPPQPGGMTGPSPRRATSSSSVVAGPEESGAAMPAALEASISRLLESHRAEMRASIAQMQSVHASSMEAVEAAIRDFSNSAGPAPPAPPEP
jgi:hypothetical protein